MRHTVVVALLLLSGCEAARSMRDDFARVTTSQPPAAKASKSTAGQSPSRPRNTPVAAPNATTPSSSTTDSNAIDPNAIDATDPALAAAASPQPRPSSDVPAVALAGKSEKELRALFGAPTNEEDRPPGKRWRYRDGQCTLDVQLYPDVQTKQFGTLAYEVKSDDNTDEGKRLCLAQLQSRVSARQ